MGTQCSGLKIFRTTLAEVFDSSLCARETWVFVCIRASHGSRKQMSGGQFARDSVTHHHARSTSANHHGHKEGSAEKEGFFGPGVDHRSGARSRRSSLAQETHCRERQRVSSHHRIFLRSLGRARRTRGRSTIQIVSLTSGSGSVGRRQPRRKIFQSICGSSQATAVGGCSKPCLKFLERVQGRVERQRMSFSTPSHDEPTSGNCAENWNR